MIGRILVAGLAMTASAAAAAPLPDYDIDEYCKTVAASVGGSYQIELMCVREEKSSRDAVSGMDDLEARLIAYCDQVASSIGGSYQILKTCIDQELGAKAQLQK